MQLGIKLQSKSSRGGGGGGFTSIGGRTRCSRKKGEGKQGYRNHYDQSSSRGIIYVERGR